MREYETVVYKYGTSQFHQPDDDAELRPNVEEITRFTMNVHQNKKHRGTLYYVYEGR
jgi:hypothetical protein